MAEDTVRLWPTTPIWDAVGLGWDKGDHYGLGISGYVDVPKGPHALALMRKGGYVQMPEPVVSVFDPGPMVLMRYKAGCRGATPGGTESDGKGNFIVPMHMADGLLSHNLEIVVDDVGLPVAAVIPGSAQDMLSKEKEKVAALEDLLATAEIEMAKLRNELAAPDDNGLMPRRGRPPKAPQAE